MSRMISKSYLQVVLGCGVVWNDKVFSNYRYIDGISGALHFL
jgi:hypothetical protein